MIDCGDADEGGSSSLVLDTEKPKHPKEQFLQVGDYKPGPKEISVKLYLMTSEEMKQLCVKLKSPDCAVEILRLTGGRLSEGCCSALISALEANPSFLRELHLTDVPFPHQTKLRLVCDALGNQHCRIRTLRIVNCGLWGNTSARLSDAIKRNPSHLKELDLSQNMLGDLGMRFLCDGLMDESCRLETLKLTSCLLSGKSCNDLNKLLMSSSCRLQDLDLSHNSLRDEGIEWLSVGLSSPNCKLSILSVAHCKVTDEGCTVLMDALKKRPVPLVDLDLQGNDFSFKVTTMLNELKISSGIGQLLRVRLGIPRDDSHRFSGSVFWNKTCSVNLSEREREKERERERVFIFSRSQGKQWLRNKERQSGAAAKSTCETIDICTFKSLQVGDHKPGPKEISVKLYQMTSEEMKQLCVKLKSPDCAVEILRLTGGRLSEGCCSALISALEANPSFLRELHLTGVTFPDQTKLRLVCDALGNQHCRIRTLRIVNCGLWGNTSARLSDAIKRNPSHLKELDLSQNMLGDLGMRFLCDGLMDESCRLETLKIVNCKLSGSSCASLTVAIKNNPSHLKVLDVSVNWLGDKGVRYLCDGLMDESCRLERLKLTSCLLSGKSCNDLNKLLMSSSCRLQDLDLSRNSLRDEGIEWLSVGLSSPNCKLSILSLAHCKVTDEGYTVLMDALKKRPVPLVELDLQGNDFSFKVTTMLNKLKICFRIGQLFSEQDLKYLLSKLPAPQSSSRPSAEEESHLKLDSGRGNTQLEEPEVDKAPSCFTFEVLDEPGRISYRFRGLGPGVFLCPLTGLGFTMTGGGELLYKIIEWDEDLLLVSGKLPAGPLFKIEGATKAVSQLHLLHCEQNPAAFPNGLSAVHMSDEGMSFLKPLEINDTHVVVDVSHFSVYGLIIDLITGILNIQRPISSQVLLFHRPTWTKDSQKVNVFLLPKNLPLEEVKSQQRNAEYLEATSFCELIGKRTYSLQCPESTLVQPRLGSRFDSSFGKVLHPNFEIRLTRETEDATVMVKYQDDTVWEYVMKLTGGEPTMTPRLPDGSGPDSGTQDRQEPMKRKLFRMREGFIDRISKPNLDSLMNRLLHEDVINEQEYQHLNTVQPVRDAAKALIDMVLKKNEDARGKMIEEFSKVDKHLYADLNN